MASYTKGLDASSVQGLLPFKQLVADGLRFVILKGQQGNDGFDPWCWRNLQGAIENGLIPGIYHFTYPLPHLDPKQQAQLFFERSKGFGSNPEELPPFIDFEWPAPVTPGKKGWKEWGCSPQQLSDWQCANAEEMHRLWGVRPVIYTYPYFFATIRDGNASLGFPSGADVSWVTDYSLWIASYINHWPHDGEVPPNMPRPWTSWTFWQFDGSGGLKLPNGIDSDFCVFNGTEEDLRALADHAPRPSYEEEQPIVHQNDEAIEALIAQYESGAASRFGLSD